jgi:hypothetical protein
MAEDTSDESDTFADSINEDTKTEVDSTASLIAFASCNAELKVALETKVVSVLTTASEYKDENTTLAATISDTKAASSTAEL